MVLRKYTIISHENKHVFIYIYQHKHIWQSETVSKKSYLLIKLLNAKNLSNIIILKDLQHSINIFNQDNLYWYIHKHKQYLTS